MLSDCVDLYHAHTLIAQSCLDHDISLVTSDRDFRCFTKAPTLRVLP